MITARDNPLVKVTRADWPSPLELEPMQSARRLAYSCRLSPRETELLVRGVVPREMEDHWFIFEEDDVVHLYRSWTGIELFAIQLRRLAGGGAEIAEVAVNDRNYPHTPRRRRLARLLRRPSIEDLDKGADEILDVFFDSLTETPTLAVVIPGHVFGLNVNRGAAGTSSSSAPT